ncbi:MAG: YciI family protein [Candidatus Methylomirabilia bacterium]
MIVYHAAITTAPDYLERRAPHRRAHLERLLDLRAHGLVIGGGPSPDGKTADIFYRTREPDQVTSLLEEDPYYTHSAWTGYRLRSFGQFVEPWESPPVVTDGSRQATLVDGIVADPEMATFALIELRGAGRLASGGFFESRQSLGLFRTRDPDEALGWLTETGFWKRDSLKIRPLLWVL